MPSFDHQRTGPSALTSNSRPYPYCTDEPSSRLWWTTCGDDGSSVQYGYGLEFDVSADGQVRWWSKEGINAGASGILQHYPDRGVDVVVLAGSEDGAWQPIRWVHDLVLGLPTID